MKKTEEVIARLKALSDPEAVAGMARFGINPERALGVSIPRLQALAKTIGRDTSLADALWASRLHEARILACMLADPAQITAGRMERWAKEFNSWDLCDQCCNRLFAHTPFAWRKAAAWAGRREEFVKRAGFVLMAVLAVHARGASDQDFEPFLDLIEAHAADERRYVKKAVNWALRQIGKRSRVLNRRAIAVAKRIRATESSAARWVAADALRELTSGEVSQRLASRHPK